MTPRLGSRHLRSLALGWLAAGSLAMPLRAAAAPSPAPPAAQSTPSQTPAEQGPPLTITIDDLAGPKGPGSPTPKHPQWEVEPGAAWWGPGGDFGDGFDDGWLW